MGRRLRKNTDFTAVGSAGFGGYLIRGFGDKDLFILESVKFNKIKNFKLRGVRIKYD